MKGLGAVGPCDAIALLQRGRALHGMIAIGVSFCLGALAAGCQSVAAPPADVHYETQQSLLENAIGRLETAPEPGDAEVVEMLRQLRAELDASQRRHLEDERRIAELEEKVRSLRHAAGFAVHHIEILYFTHVGEKGIDLWVTPFDRHNDVVKTAGSFKISLHVPGPWGLRKLGRAICAWQFSAPEVERCWEGQLFEGYHLKLAWPQGEAPDVETATLAVAFTTAEGKTYDATKELNIRE